MRHKLIIEGMLYEDGRFIKKGALIWTDDPIPVYMTGLNNRVIGKACDLMREDDNSISAEIYLLPNELEEYGSVSVDLTNVDFVNDEKMLTVNSGRIRAVAFVNKI